MNSGSEVLPNPVEMTNTYKIVSYTYQFNNLQLFVSVSVQLCLIDDSGNVRKVVNYLVQGNEYAQWGGDDQYMINLLNSKIPGLV
jgi:hypothetical protein